MCLGSRCRCGWTQALWKGPERPLCLLASHLHLSLHFSALSPPKKVQTLTSCSLSPCGQGRWPGQHPPPPPLSRKTSSPRPPLQNPLLAGQALCCRACRTHLRGRHRLLLR